jgi:prophage maintenance system killer protein
MCGARGARAVQHLAGVLVERQALEHHLAALVFLEINGVDALPEPDDLEKASLAVAASEMSKDALADWMRAQVGGNRGN